MKLAIHTHTPFQLHLSEKARETIFSAICVLIPYAIAAIGVFAYHKQWFI